jgi:hypothetical protein
VRCAAFTLSAGLSKGIVAPLWGHLPVGSPPCGVTSLWGHLPVGSPPCGSAALGAMRPQTADFAYSNAPSPRGRGSHESTPPITARCRPRIVGGARFPSQPGASPKLWERRPRRDAASNSRLCLFNRPIAARARLPQEHTSHHTQVQAPSCGSAALGAMQPQTADFAYSVAPSPRGRGSHRSTLPITPMGKPKVVGGARFTLRPWASPQLWERRPRRDWACPKSSTPFKRPIAARARLPQGWAILLHAEKVSLP